MQKRGQGIKEPTFFILVRVASAFVVLPRQLDGGQRVTRDLSCLARPGSEIARSMVRCLFALAGLSVSSSASRHFFDLTIGDRIGAPAAEAFQQPAPGHLATVNDLTLAGLRGAVIIEQFRRTALGRRFRLGRTSRP